MAGQSLSGSLAGGITNPAIILGANLVEWWDVRYGVTVVSGEVRSLVGQSGGRILSTAGTAYPTYTATDSDFAGKPSLATMLSPARGLSGSGLTQLFAAGSRPYLYLFGRMTALPTDTSLHRGLSVGTVAILCAGTAVTSDISFDSNGTRAKFTTPDTDPHLYEGWSDGVNSYLASDGVTVATAADTTASANATVAALGYAEGTLHYGDFEIVGAGVCTAVPSASQRARLRAYGQSAWGMP